MMGTVRRAGGGIPCGSGELGACKAVSSLLVIRRVRGRAVMATVQVEIPMDALSAIRRAPEAFVAGMRIAAAVRRYELELISQSNGSEIAGLSRAEFLDALSRYRVSAFKQTADEIAAEHACPACGAERLHD